MYMDVLRVYCGNPSFLPLSPQCFMALSRRGGVFGGGLVGERLTVTHGPAVRPGASRCVYRHFHAIPEALSVGSEVDGWQAIRGKLSFHGAGEGGDGLSTIITDFS